MQELLVGDIFKLSIWINPIIVPKSLLEEDSPIDLGSYTHRNKPSSS